MSHTVDVGAATMTSKTLPPGPPGRRGPESPELRTLRLAENDMFNEYEPSANLDPMPAHDAYAGDPESCNLPNPQAVTTSMFPPSMVPPQDDFLRGLAMPDLPVRRHPGVAKYVRYFTGDAKGRKMFTSWLRRSGKYRQVISKALAARNLPKDLEAVVFIESGLWPTAVSSAGATGLWQFMPKTARAYGLTVTPQFDERRSIWRATEAATEHLGDLFARFQSWDLALAAYNLGYDGLENRLRLVGTSDFWVAAGVENALPKETALYVPKVLAVAVILNNLEHFGFGEVELEPALDAAEIEAPPGVSLSVLARAAGTSVNKIKEYNPELRGSSVPDRGSPVILHIPSQGRARARVMLPRLLGDEHGDLEQKVSPDFDWGRDEVADDGLTRLERTGRNPPSAPSASVPAKSPLELGPGDDIVPDQQTQSALDQLLSGAVQGATTPAAPSDQIKASFSFKRDGASGDKQTVLYRVSRGDTLSGIAQSFGTSQARVIAQNGIDNPSLLLAGQVLRLELSPKRASKRSEIYYKVQPGDTVDKLALTYGVDPATLQTQASKDGHLPVGKIISLSLATEREEAAPAE